MPSPRFKINGQAAATPYTAVAGQTITLTLESTAGVTVANWSFYGKAYKSTNALAGAAAVYPIITVDPTTLPIGVKATFTLATPLPLGAAYSIGVTINNGVDLGGNFRADWTTTSVVIVDSANGYVPVAGGQTFEGDDEGWQDNINTTLAAAGSGGAIGLPVSGDLSGTLPSPSVVNMHLAGQTKGSVSYFDGSAWQPLTPGTDGYALTTHGAGNNPTWASASSVGSSAPVNVDKSAASAGTSTQAARADHHHDTNTGTAVSVGTANAEGTATTLARSDHTHLVSGLGIASQTKGDTLYFDGTSWVRLAAAQDGYLLTTHTSSSAPSWTAGSPLTSTAPNDVDKSTALTGVSGFAARSDHKHSILTATAGSIGATNAEGSANTLARSDHTHSVVDLNIAGQVQGNVLFFNGTNWVRLANSTDGYYLTTHSTGANPTWTKAPTAGTDINVPGQTRGDILYYNGTAWTLLHAGTAGQALITQGASANPIWSTDLIAQNLKLGTSVTFASNSVNPNVLQATNTTTVSGVGQSLNVTSQSSSGFNSRGGNLTLSSGTGTSAQGAPDGYVIINRGTQQVAQWAGGSTFSNNTNDDFINFGRQPASQGNIRGDKNFQIWGRNNTNTGDINLMFWQGSTNNFILGASSPPSATIIRSTATTIQSNTTTVISDFNFPILTIINSANTLAAIFNASNSAVAAELIVGSQNIQSSTTIPMLIAGSSALAFNSRGGSLTLASGSGTSGQGAPDGYLILNRGTQTVASWTTGNPNPTTIDDFISLGRIPASQGNIRGASNFNIFGRNSANTDDVSLLSYSNNTVTLSSNIKTAANTNVWGTLIQLVHGSGGVSIFDNASGSVYLNFSNSGTIRVASFVSTTTGSANISCGSLNIISTTTSPFNILAGNAIGFNSRGGNLQLSSGAGTSTQGAPDGYVLINRGSQLVAQWQTGTTAGSTIDDFIIFGKTPATVGNVRLTNLASLAWRNAGNSANITAMQVDGSNNLLVGDGTADITYNANNVNTFNHIFKLAGSAVLNVGLGQIQTNVSNFTFSGSSAAIGFTTSLASSGTFAALTLQGQSGGASSGTYAAGDLSLRGGNATSGGTGTHSGGNIYLVAGTGGTSAANGNIGLGGIPASWNSMAGGIFVPEGAVIPTGNPTNGFYLFQDPSDHQVYIRTQAGVIKALTP